MKHKNKELWVIVGILFLSVGMSFAFFVAQTYLSGTGSRTTVTTATINGANLKVEGTLEFGDENVYPGHSSISGIKVTATGNNELVPYNLVWTGTNSISQLNYTVYKTSSNIQIETECEKKMKVIDGAQVLSEFCEFTNIDKLGEPVETGSINKDDTKVTLVKDEFITATSDGQKVYYYVVLEFPNLESIQNADLGGSFDGRVTVEKSDKQPDINILAFKVIDEEGNIEEKTELPTSGNGIEYIFNQESSTCTNEAVPHWDSETKVFTATNLTKSGTSCYLAFNKVNGQTSATIVAAIKSSGASYKGATAPTFTEVATEAETADNNGIFETDDPMYTTTENPNPKTYYWRGAATTNHVIFANKCWRIVRINGDNTMRLIYNGSVLENNTCFGNGSNEDSITQTGVKYNINADNNSYVGWTYKKDYQRPIASINGTEATSEIKSISENWFNDDKYFTVAQRLQVVEGKFCNDRRTRNNEEWRATGGYALNYAAYQRLFEGTKTPNLDCTEGDIYHLKVGAITADEAQFAGASAGINNNSYYLNNGKNYWTMSPKQWLGNNNSAEVFAVNSSGFFSSMKVNANGIGIRPVINLDSTTTFNLGGTGTSDNPYVVP